MLVPSPVALERGTVRLEPMQSEHRLELADAARDGELWNIWFTHVPTPDEVQGYIEQALRARDERNALPWVVRDLATGALVGSTRLFNVEFAIDTAEIGYTWYAKSFQRSHVNASCKLLILTHAFDTLGCKAVRFCTDAFNFKSQGAIAALGAHRDGVIRHHRKRRDGSVRDSVVFSILLGEWPTVRGHLEYRIKQRQSG